MFSIIPSLAPKYVDHSSLRTLWSSNFFSCWQSLVPWLIGVLYAVGYLSSSYTLVLSNMYLLLTVTMSNSLISPTQSHPTPNYVSLLHASSYMWSLYFILGHPGTLIKSLAWKTAYAAAWDFFPQLPSYCRYWWILFIIEVLSGWNEFPWVMEQSSLAF